MCPPAPKWARWGSISCPEHRKSSGREQKPTEMCPPAPKWARWGSKSCPRHRESCGREQKPTEMCPPAPKWARWGSKSCPRHRKSCGREQKPIEMCPPGSFRPRLAPSVHTWHPQRGQKQHATTERPHQAPPAWTNYPCSTECQRNTTRLRTKLPCGLRLLPLGCCELYYKHYGKAKQHEANTLP